MLKTSEPTAALSSTNGNANGSNGHSNGYSSQSTLTSYYGNLDVVVFGSGSEFTAAVMVGLTPAIEGEKAPQPDAALRKLYTATTELLKEYIPKVGDHQRAIHGGGVFDEDMISSEIVDAKRKGPA